jgi:pimeloyl-ACP methyl ester carboxylesterase
VSDLHKSILCAFLLLVVSATTTVAGTSVRNGVVFTPASLPFEVPADSRVEFGYLRVPEVRADPNSRWIEVPVAIMKSRSLHPAPDPLIHIIGGPGSSHLTTTKYGDYIPYLDDRDYVVFEQRGSRYARPSLACPEWDNALMRNMLEGGSESERAARWAGAARDCEQRFAEEGIDLNGYRTTEIAADIEDFRRLMGYDSYNILAVSYGTKVAQVLLRDHPAAIRSVVLDSPLPLEVNFEEDSLENRDAVLARVFDDCAADADCAGAYPDLAVRFWAAIAYYNENPVEVPANHPETGEGVTILVTGRRLLAAIEPSNTEDMPNVPRLADAVARGELESILAGFANYSFTSGYSMGLRLACWCAEETPFVDFAKVARFGASHPRFTGVSPVFIDPAACGALGVTPALARENQPVVTDRPVLLISGGYDAATPTDWARRILARAPHGFLVSFPQWGHAPTGNWNTPCAQALVVDFLRNPGQEPRNSCREELAPIRFLVEGP